MAEYSLNYRSLYAENQKFIFILLRAEKLTLICMWKSSDFYVDVSDDGVLLVYRNGRKSYNPKQCCNNIAWQNSNFPD